MKNTMYSMLDLQLHSYACSDAFERKGVLYNNTNKTVFLGGTSIKGYIYSLKYRL